MARNGPEWERQFCKLLSAWWLQDPDADAVFWRTRGSGGRATTRSKKGQQAELHCGDVGALTADAETLTKFVTIELKKGYNQENFHSLLDRPAHLKGTSKFSQWIDQASTAAANAKTPYWWVVHRRTGRDALLLAPEPFFTTVRRYSLHPRPVALFTLTGTLSVGAMKLDEFFEHTTPGRVRDSIATYKTPGKG